MKSLTAALAAIILSSPHGAIAQVPSITRVIKVQAERVTYRGQEALRVSDAGDAGEDRMAVLAGPDFIDGEISLLVAGERGPRARPSDRGFVGIAFRIAATNDAFEGIYLRPENARADDQLRRNRTLQYHSPPEWTWQRLRAETPGVYETYVDMEPGAWTRLRVQVDGSRASVYVGDASQPSLVVTDLKRGPGAAGPVGLWVGPGTVAHFADVRVRPKTP